MRIIKYIRRAILYLQLAGLAGLYQVVRAKLTQSIALLRISRSGCRFPFRVRFPSSDLQTFEQIFVRAWYDFLVKTQPRVIIDGGANIGLASIYFANKYPDAKIIAIEPEQNNFELLRENVAPYANIIPLQAALWHVNEELDLLDPGRGQWGFVTQHKKITQDPVQTQPGTLCHTVQAITIDRLMDEFALDRINILKIDIEGAEKEVFSHTAAWIDKVDSVVIELYDALRPGCVDSFYNGSAGFDQEWWQGENLIRTRNNWLIQQTA